MSLPPIYSSQTVIYPETTTLEKSYPDNYLTHLLVTEPNSYGVQRLLVVYRPYNYSTGDIYPDRTKDQVLPISDLMSEAIRAPLLAQAIYYVVQSASLLLQEKTLVEQILLMSEGEDKEIKKAELSTIRTSLGI
jgi:hypothetical protein